MKAYKAELIELQEWMREETKKYFAEIDSLADKGLIIRDGDETYRFNHETIPAYNKKLKELKRKYNVK